MFLPNEPRRGTARPSVLIVTPVFTNPPTQGNAARILALGRGLKSAGMDVDVLHYGLDDFSIETRQAMDREWRHTFHIQKEGHKRPAFATCWGLDDWCPDSVVAAVEQQTRRRFYSAVIVNYVWMSRCFEKAAPGTLKILDTHDLFGDRHGMALQAGMEPSWYFTTAREEARGFDRADLVLGIQPEETGRIRASTSRKVLNLGHLIEPVVAEDQARSEILAPFGYMGSGNPWNVASVIQFDAALAECGQPFRWIIAGGVSGSARRLRSVPLNFGDVKTPWDFYRHVGCVVNPMVGGTGLKIKTVEALAHGRPVIGTRSAFAGLETTHAFQQLETASEVVTAARSYLSSSEIRVELCRASLETQLAYARKTQDELRTLAATIRDIR